MGKKIINIINKKNVPYGPVDCIEESTCITFTKLFQRGFLNVLLSKKNNRVINMESIVFLVTGRREEIKNKKVKKKTLLTLLYCQLI